MNTGRRSRLVIISVPLYRIARLSLSELVLGSLRDTSDVVIVAPFAEEASFIQNFCGRNTTFVRWEAQRLNRVQRMLLTISELMRRNGYWRRFKRQGMSYYVANQFTVFGEEGQDTRLSASKSFAYWVVSLVGQWPQGWRLVERLLGTRWYQLPPLVASATQYESVTLIQSANWGPQDRALARLARAHGWRSVLLPYTSDQLDVNGYLLNDFDAVCVQGPYEFDRARSHHRIPASRICCLGSVWGRHLEAIHRRLEGRVSQSREPATILYAGTAAAYFPRQSEFDAVDAVLDFVSRSAESYRLVYRPVAFDERSREEILQRYGGVREMQLQWPSISCLGLEQYVEVDHEQSLREYVSDIAGCTVVIMSSFTSLALDAALLGRCGVIANLSDKSGAVKRRRVDLLPMDGYPGFRLANSIPELLVHLEYVLSHPEQAAAEAAQTLAQWDYANANVRDALLEAVHGEQHDVALASVPVCRTQADH